MLTISVFKAMSSLTTAMCSKPLKGWFKSFLMR